MTKRARQEGYLLAVDGGGTKTRALIARASGARLGEGLAPSSNYHRVGPDGALAAIEQAIAAAWADCARGRRARRAPKSFAAACFGLAGMDGDEDRLLMTRWLAARRIANRFIVLNDAELVLAAGTPRGEGVALLCGTGSICFGRAANGRMARAGGWGYLLGDEGSGYHIGITALHVATQTADGRTDADAIPKLVLAHWSLREPEQLLSILYRPETTLAEIAALAPKVLALARRRDAHALRLLDRAAIALARDIEVVVRRLKLRRPPIAFGGGLLSGTPTLRRAVLARTRVKLGRGMVVVDPARGGLLLARRLLAEPER